MLQIFLIALIVGAGLLLFSLFASGDGGGKPEIDGHADLDAGHGHDHDHGLDAGALAWLPLASLRFWTFFMAFFGATGTALTFTERDINAWVLLAIAVAMGYVCGAAAVSVFRYMRRSETTSNLAVDDYIGETAVVRVAVARGKTGKVRLELKGRTLELLAETEEETPFAVKDRAMIYAVTARGHVILTRANDPRPGRA
jgi:membrane protein implicated in regulation of membrane protease activity